MKQQNLLAGLPGASLSGAVVIATLMSGNTPVAQAQVAPRMAAPQGMAAPQVAPPQASRGEVAPVNSAPSGPGVNIELKDTTLADALEMNFKIMGNPAHVVHEAAKSVPIRNLKLQNVQAAELPRILANQYNFEVVRSADGTYLVTPRMPRQMAGGRGGRRNRGGQTQGQGGVGNPFGNQGGRAGQNGTRGQGGLGNPGAAGAATGQAGGFRGVRGTANPAGNGDTRAPGAAARTGTGANGR